LPESLEKEERKKSAASDVERRVSDDEDELLPCFGSDKMGGRLVALSV
jgi:hypothetical protein